MQKRAAAMLHGILVISRRTGACKLAGHLIMVPQVVTMMTCNRFGRAAAWCPVQEGDCGLPTSKARSKLGWSRWDL